MLISLGLDPDLIPLMLRNGCRNYVALKPNLKYPELNFLGDDRTILTQITSGATFFFGFDDPKMRKKLFTEFKFEGTSLISDTVVCLREIGSMSGITLADLVFIGPGTEIQDFVKIGVRASIHHDSKIGKFSVVGPSATICGRVVVGDEVFIGAGATILPGLNVGNNSVIGAGAVVTRDVLPNACVLGVPAKPFSKLSL